MLYIYTAEHFKQRRLEMGLSLAKVARMLGNENVAAGMRRIESFEEAGEVDPDLLTRLATVLGIDERTTNRLAYMDYRSWFVLTTIPVVPCVYRRTDHDNGAMRLPKRLKTNEARERFAADYAKKCGTDVCLMVNPRVKLWFSGDGSLLEIVEVGPDDI